MAVVYSVSKEELSPADVSSLLKNIDVSKISNVVPQKPLGDEVYAYRYGDIKTADDWVADGYRWVNNGTDRLPKRDPVVYKRKFKAWTPDGGTTAFKRLIRLWKIQVTYWFSTWDMQSVVSTASMLCFRK